MSDAIAARADWAQGVRWGRRVRRVARSGVVVAGVVVALLVVGVAVFAPVVAPHAPDEPNFELIEAPPGPKAWFGTDRFGRDILSRVIFGSRISLYVAGASIGASMLLGGTLGLTAGYAGGAWDNAINAEHHPPHRAAVHDYQSGRRSPLPLPRSADPVRGLIGRRRLHARICTL